MKQENLHAGPMTAVWAMRLLAIGLVALGTACDRADDPAARTYAIGLITNNPNGMRNVAGFEATLAEHGYVEGRNVRFLSAGEPVASSALEGSVRDMLDAGVDLIFTAGTPTGVAAHRATRGSGVPVVFGVIADPIAAGVVTDLTRPGGNMTGVKLSQNQSRRLELLKRLVPGVRRVLVPYNPTDSAPVSAVRQLEDAAPALDIELVLGHAFERDRVAEMIAELADRVDAIFLVPDSTVNPRLRAVLDIAIARRLPVSGPSTAQVEEGALTAYGFDHRGAGAQAARMARQVLEGANPGDLPVQTAEFFLAVNLATAEAIGLDVPDVMIQTADIVVRGD